MADGGDPAPMTLNEIRGLPPVGEYLDHIRRQRPFEKPRGRQLKVGVTERSSPRDHADLRLAIKIGKKLDENFPGYEFRVEVEHDQGIAKINLPLFMGLTKWFVIHLYELKGDPGLHRVLEAGGELLERFKLPRSGINQADWLAACSKVTLAAQRRGDVPD